MEGQRSSTPRACKRSPALTNSTWYKGILGSVAPSHFSDNEVKRSVIIRGPRHVANKPPHVHSREDELFYLLSGEIRVYVDGEVFPVTAGRMRVSSSPKAPCIPYYV
jgi:mannose-6-phosphate isomerase-like protein (cupin superfamily)